MFLTSEKQEIYISQSATKTVSSRIAAAPAKKLANPRLFKTPTLRKASRRRLTRFAVIGGNVLLFAAVAYIVMAPSHSSATVTGPEQLSSNAATPSHHGALDQLASASIAQEVAQMTGVEELIPITNQADSERLTLNQASLEDTTLASKPQVIETDYKSNKDIQTYIVKRGDNVSKIASKFGVTSNSIRWSNNLSGDTVAVGKKLHIPPVNGIVHKVTSGDTPASLAQKYGVAKDKIVAYNDAELHGLRIGSLIILPGASIEAPSSYGGYSSGSSSRSSSFYSYQPVYGYNGYTYGYCTWYVATRINIPANWGNAYSWDTGAAATPGFVVNKTPSAGSILQDDGSLYGTYHVAYVESVRNGRVYVSEMNVRTNGGGWGIVSRNSFTLEQVRANSVDFIHKL